MTTMSTQSEPDVRIFKVGDPTDPENAYEPVTVEARRDPESGAIVMFQPLYSDYDDVRTGPLFPDSDTAFAWIEADKAMHKANGDHHYADCWSVDEVEIYPSATEFVLRFSATGRVTFVRDEDTGRIERQKYLGLERSDRRTWHSDTSAFVCATADLDDPHLTSAEGHAVPTGTRMVEFVYAAEGGSKASDLLRLIDRAANDKLAELRKPGAFEQALIDLRSPTATGTATTARKATR